MKTLGIIPARYASSRFPGKPLIDILGKSMIYRVYSQSAKSKRLDDVVVATDDQRIFDHIEKLGGKVVMTGTHHRSGTDRCAEVARMNEFQDCTHFVNIQGDEPYIDPGQIDLLISCFDMEHVKLATLVRSFTNITELESPNSIKVVLNNQEEALYFSRSTIPFLRGVPEPEWINKHYFYQHIGIYGYSRSALLKISGMEPGKLEKAESLEQLRWLENGLRIHVKISEHESHSIDTPEDLERIKKLMQK